MAAVNLDDVKIYHKLDPEGMLARVKELPMQCRQAWKSMMDFNLPADYHEVNKIVVLGMGGSAIGGDLVRTLVQGECKRPVIIHRDYGLPAFVDNRTLLIASSYSGNTEETLSGFEESLKTEAKKLVMTTGGKLAEMAAANNVPVFKIEYRAQPRAALGHSFLPTLGVLNKLGFIKDRSADVNEAVEVLEKISAKLDDKSALKSNRAKQIAQRLYGCLPVIYGAGIAAEAAHRWKTQINENSKAWCFHEIFPELNHNATVGFAMPKEVISKIRVILLRSSTFTRRINLRYEVTCELLKQAGITYEFVDGEGQSPLGQMMSLVMMGDFVSYYLAILYNVDPSPVKVISYLKGRLEKG
jgi:glucose/mannose-6-phosphate isomerase